MNSPERLRTAEGAPPAAAVENDVKSWVHQRSRWTKFLERLALMVERPANRLIGNPQLNPFYHTGTIAVLLLIVVGLTGFYIFLFFQYGYEASYNAVARYQEQPFARIMRSVHRYASGALVITTLLHAFRMLFMERFRGPRWLAWLTGIGMTLILWAAGVTGYWLIWDVRAQLITDSFLGFLEKFTTWVPALMVRLVTAADTGRSWPIFLLVLGIHVLLFGLTAVLVWLHVRRLSRPKWLPEIHWAVGAGVVLVLMSAIFPARMLPQADFSQLPGPVRLDPIFLFYVPLSNTAWSYWLWGGIALFVAWATLLPWLPRRSQPPLPPRVNVLDASCVGCTKCAQDCPYEAIHMVERADQSRHKLLAVADPELCVSCGICIGSCDDYFAITLDDVPPQSVEALVTKRVAQAQARSPEAAIKVIFTCERHAAQGAQPYLDGREIGDLAVEVIPLPCAGAVQPSLLPRILALGAAEVAVVGCPVNDCANREGNLWGAQRVTHERVPRLRKQYDTAPITAAWLPPDDFAQALPLTTAAVAEDEEPDFLSTRRILEWLTWRNFVVGFCLLAAVLVAQIWLTGLDFQAFPERPAVVQVLVPDPAIPFRLAEVNPPAGESLTLRLELDDQVAFEHAYSSTGAEVESFFETLETNAGPHMIRLTFRDARGNHLLTLVDETRTLGRGEILALNYLEEGVFRSGRRPEAGR